MTFHVLILCTHNSARSVLSEGMLNHWAQRLGLDVKAHSAGSAPSGRVNPFALEALANAGIDVGPVRSKSWDEFTTPDAPPLSLVITVGDNAAGEACPYWPGQPATAHWGYADPSAVEGGEDRQREAFRQTLHLIRKRLEAFVNLPPERLDRLSIQQAARHLAQVNA